MNGKGLTERQSREIEFYESYSRKKLTTGVCFDPVAGKESRPWNSYWRVYELARGLFTGRERLLDFCCGTGATSLLFAKIGFEVCGFDITPANIEIAKGLSAEHGLELMTSFSVQAAEKTQYPSGSFDVIAGIDVLHHIEIPSAMEECRRLLRPGGVAVFREPVESIFFEPIRNSRMGLRLFPKKKSLESHVTEDERKLNDNDIAIIRKAFPNFTEERFTFLSRLDPFIRDPKSAEASFLEKLDRRLFKAFPPLRGMGGGAVFILKKD